MNQYNTHIYYPTHQLDRNIVLFQIESLAKPQPCTVISCEYYLPINIKNWFGCDVEIYSVMKPFGRVFHDK